MLLIQMQLLMIKARLVRLALNKRLYTTFNDDDFLNKEIDKFGVIYRYIRRYNAVYGYVTDLNGNLVDLTLLYYLQLLEGMVNQYSQNKPFSLSSTFQCGCCCKTYPL